MRAIVASRAGGPEVLELATAPDPEPGPTDVLVEVAFAGVNFADVVMRRGEAMTPLPLVPGVEGSGRVIAIGSDVTDVAIGDRVAWAPVHEASSIGSYAELAVIGAAQTLPLPPDVTLLDAAALTLQGLTAHYLATEQYPLGPGTTVLVHAGAGGTGRTVVQWASHLGATVFATVSTDDKAAVARAAGAAHTIRYDEVDFVDEVRRLTEGAGVNYIVDGVGGATFRAGIRALAERGRICVFGRAAGPPEKFSPMELFLKSLTVSGGQMTHFLRTREEVLRKADDVWRGRREGWLTPAIHGVYPLADAAGAHAALESRGTTGKLVLEVSGER
ncbi:MAG: quinone oxidoreductase [Acidimicrobiales bacterium]|nr:quinone oxidoreductase [Acidimicrobiales bacterium]